MKNSRPMFPCLVLAVVFVLQLGAAAEAALPKPAAPPVPSNQGGTTTFDQLPDSAKPIAYTSPDGQFSTTFPTGCARLRTKANVGADGTTDVDVRMVFVTCDRNGNKGEGCLVNARLGVLGDRRGQAAVDVVVAEITSLLEGYGVVPARQLPVTRDFGPHGKVEGLDVQAHPKSGSGDVWIRGLMRGADMYFLVAWKSEGGLFDDPEYAQFFGDFKPWIE